MTTVVKEILEMFNNFCSIVQKVSNVNGVQAKMDSVKRNMAMVSARKAEINSEVEQEERRPAKKRRGVVELWRQNVESMEAQVHELGTKVKEGGFFSRLILAPQVSAVATEVDKLGEMARFDQGLTCVVKPARGYELQPRELGGQASQTKRDEIWDCLMKEDVLRVGVWGPAGGGNLVTKHIHDQIVRDCPRFDGAYLVHVSQEGTVGTIQTDIAKYLELDLTGVSTVYWGARLREALQGSRLLLILDDVRKSFPLEEVGIDLERDGCKLIVISRSRDVCEQMNCHEFVQVPHGSEDELWWGSETVQDYIWGR